MPGISIQGWHGRLHRGHLDLAGSAQQLQFGHSLLLETSQVFEAWCRLSAKTHGHPRVWSDLPSGNLNMLWRKMPYWVTWSRKLAVTRWSFSCFSKGCGRPESNTVKNRTPPSSRGILGWCWKQMVTGSNPARSLGNLYSECPHPIKIPSKSHQNPIKIPSCFQAHVNLSFRSPPLGPWASSFPRGFSLPWEISWLQVRTLHASAGWTRSGGFAHGHPGANRDTWRVDSSFSSCSHGDGAVGMGITALRMVQVFLIT